MSCRNAIAPQRLAPRSGAAMTCAGRPGLLSGGENNHDLGRWRSQQS